MRIRAKKSFTARYQGQTYRASAGDELEVPDKLGVTLTAFVEVLDGAQKAVRPQAKGVTSLAQPVTVIEGIGPKTAQALAELGIETTPQLAAAEDLPEEFARFQDVAQQLMRGG